jgi:photosystem II stability/assembly factor-like uncharacterized protein
MINRRRFPRWKWTIGPLEIVCATVLILSGCTSSSTAEWSMVHRGEMPHAAAVQSIYFVDKDQGWALTWAGLFKLRDQGRTWLPILTNDGERKAFYSFAFTSPSNGIIVGTQEKDQSYTVLILRTSDGGESWQEGITDIKPETDRNKSPAIHKIAFCDEKNGWGVGPNLIVHTIDGGNHWIIQRRSVDEENLIGIGCVNSERAWAVGSRGLVLKTNDSGSTWTQQRIGTEDTLMQVRFFGQHGWIVGGTAGNAVLFRSSDGGENWQLQQQNVKALLFDVFFVADHGWIAGESGTMLETDDGGRTWLPRETPTKENLTSLFFLSPDQGWVGGDRATLLFLSK